MFNMSIKIMTWNVQGAAKPAFFPAFKEIVRINKPNVIALVEPTLAELKLKQSVIKLVSWAKFGLK